MTDDDARKLATRAIDTWPAGPRAYIWQNDLQPLDYDQAVEAFKLMRNEVDKATTAAFHERYRALTRKRGTGIPHHDYSGAISFADHIATLNARADAGDHDAERELATWTRLDQWPSRNPRKLP